MSVFWWNSADTEARSAGKRRNLGQWGGPRCPPALDLHQLPDVSHGQYPDSEGIRRDPRCRVGLVSAVSVLSAVAVAHSSTRRHSIRAGQPPIARLVPDRPLIPCILCILCTNRDSAFAAGPESPRSGRHGRSLGRQPRRTAGRRPSPRRPPGATPQLAVTPGVAASIRELKRKPLGMFLFRR